MTPTFTINQCKKMLYLQQQLEYSNVRLVIETAFEFDQLWTRFAQSYELFRKGQFQKASLLEMESELKGFLRRVRIE